MDETNMSNQTFPKKTEIKFKVQVWEGTTKRAATFTEPREHITLEILKSRAQYKLSTDVGEFTYFNIKVCHKMLGTNPNLLCFPQLQDTTTIGTEEDLQEALLQYDAHETMFLELTAQESMAGMRAGNPLRTGMMATAGMMPGQMGMGGMGMGGMGGMAMGGMAMGGMGMGGMGMGGMGGGMGGVVCPHFMRGNCKFGANCSKSHDPNAMGQMGGAMGGGFAGPAGLDYESRRRVVNQLANMTSIPEDALNRMYDDFMIKSKNTGNLSRQDLVKALTNEPSLRLPVNLAEQVAFL